MTTSVDTVTQILIVAQQLIQDRGYNAFSYADIAAVVGIKKASIHYYFPSKSDLCQAVIHRHRLTLRTHLTQIDEQTQDARQKFERYLRLYADIQQVPDFICLGGMLAADVQSLSHEVRTEVQNFFLENQDWLATVIVQGVEQGTFHAVESIQSEAQLIVAAVQGALLLARTFNEPRQFLTIAQRLYQDLCVSS